MKRTSSTSLSVGALPRFIVRWQERVAPSAMRLVGLSAFVMTGSLACSEREQPDGIGSGDPSGYTKGPCAEGGERVCGVTLSQENGVMSCYRGTQYCAEGEWGPCTDGTVSREAIPDFESDEWKDRRPLALSTPQPCNGTGLGGGASQFENPCDPRCMYYDEIKEVTTTPGSGSGGVPNWSSPPGTAPCSHELCATGVVLDSTCHPCVDRVCSVDASCCTGASADSWDSDCVDLVYSECATSTPNPPITLCDYTAFGEDYVTLGNGSTGFPTIGSNGDVTPQNPAQLGPIVAKGLVNLRNSTTVIGDVITESDIWLESPATVTGDLWAGGRIDVRNTTSLNGSVTATGAIEIQTDSNVTGDVWAGSTLWMGSNVQIGGDASSVGNMYGQTGVTVGGTATVEPPSTIDVNISATNGKDSTGPVSAPSPPTVTLPDLSGFERDLSASCALAPTSTTYVGSVVTLPPGIYENYTINGSGRLRLQDGGTYIFRSLRFNNGSELWLDGTAPWDVSLCDDFHSDANVKFYIDGTTTPPNAEDLLIYADAPSGDCIYIGDDNVVNGMFIAPKCRIRVYNDSVATAALWGKAVYTNSSFTLHGIPKDVCDSANQWGNAICDGTTPLYKDGYSYGNGARVHYDGNIYECASSSLCSSGGGYGGGVGYWPGEGDLWNASTGGAWYFVSVCPPPPDDPSVIVTPECPVDLTLAATPGPREDCHSGLDCQVNARCTEVLTDPSCSHTKCSVGAALDPSCDPCVVMICALDSSCCTDTGGNDWDIDCVDRVETVCDASCGELTPGCAHDACVTGPALDAACDPNVANVCSQFGFASCCDLTTPGAWTQSCIDELYLQETGSPPSAVPAGESVCDYALLGQGAAQLNSVTVDGNVAWLGGTIVFQEQYMGAGYSSTTGDFVAWNNATFDRVNIGGDLAIGLGPSTVDGLTSPPWTYSTISGTAILSGAVLPSAPARPSVTMTCPTGGADTTNAMGFIPSGTHGQVQLAGDVTLEAGDYYFESLTNNGHTITLPTDPSERVDIYVCQNVEMHDGARLLSPGGDPVQARVYTDDGVMNLGSMGSPTTLWGIFQANAGTITLSPAGSGVTVHGMVHSYWGAVQGNRGATIDASGLSRDDCIARRIDDSGAPSACPITTSLATTIRQTGACVDNGLSHRVSSSVCADVDLAIDRSCDERITICNHGNTDAPAGQVQLSFYPRAGQQFATTSPDPTWSVGTCSTTSDVPAGGCIVETCSASLLDDELTVMANLTHDASVTECSELDNWGYHVGADTCPAASPAVEVQEYEAVCPTGTSVSWGFLIWDTTLEGASTVTFEARSSFDGAFSGPPTLLGTSASSPDDTSTCSFLSPLTQCPVDVGSTLWPGGAANQPPYLELTITLSPSGADVPTLHDWGLTYSCRYDE